MKKKGFTLVELLAVIAILAILVIIALPNVMGMFNQAKQNSFTTEIKEIYKQAQQQWISDSMMNTTEINYWCVGGTSASEGTGLTDKSGIKLTGRTQLDYYITIDKSGKVIKYYATDGSYQYYYDNSAGLEVEKIGDSQSGANAIVQVSTLSSGSYVCIKNNGGDPVTATPTNTATKISATCN